MVETALLVPEKAAQEVADEYGEASIRTLKEAFTEDELRNLERECREDPEMEVVVFAALDSIERERVAEAAQEAGQEPSEWMMKATRETVLNDPLPVGHTSIERLVENTIFRNS